ncbi:carotenoid oxygenase family protein [Microcoleus sp. ZQ-A2]|nr:carotenoid oxygenase family protein [Microcoleus sp. FACHB-1]
MVSVQNFTRSSIGQYEATISGAWPQELSGHIFVAAPYHQLGERHLFGGAGVTIRWDLAPQNGKVKLLCKRVNTWDSFWQDLLPLTWRQRAFFPARMSLFGIAEPANTGVVNMNGRLLLTADAGRYWEVDPVTLETITPVGYFDEHIISVPLSFFPMVANTAHPFYDPETGELISCELKCVPRPGQLFYDMISQVYITVWDGKGTLKHWELDGTQLDGSPHTIILTEECAMIPDMPFQMGLTTLMGLKVPPTNAYPHTQVYIVDRKDLTAANYKVPARLVTFPGDSYHFLCNYRHNDGNIQMVAVQQGTISLTQSLEPSDVMHFTGKPYSEEYWGIPWMFGFDPGVLRKVAIGDGQVIQEEAFIHPGWYSTMLYTADPREQFTASGYSAIYQGYAGYWRDLICRRQYLAFRDHPNRILTDKKLPTHNLPSVLARIPLAEDWKTLTAQLEKEQQEHPERELPSLGREFIDFYVFPDDCLLDSIQYIPQGKGYIFTKVFVGNHLEAWLFAADNLKNGPVAKLTLPDKVNFGFTLHSEYFEKLVSAPPSYRVDRVSCALRSLAKVPREFIFNQPDQVLNR